MARTKATVDAIGWRAQGTDEYFVEVSIIGKLPKKDEDLIKAIFDYGWRLTGSGWNPTIKKANEYCTYKTLFEDPKVFRAWGKQFPWPLYEKNMKTGKQKLLNKKLVKDILKERELLETK